jgi:CheY-like chemotaxis protein
MFPVHDCTSSRSHGRTSLSVLTMAQVIEIYGPNTAWLMKKNPLEGNCSSFLIRFTLSTTENPVSLSYVGGRTFAVLRCSPRLIGSPQRKFLMHKRILLVDDNALIRGLVRLCIESRPGFEVCGEAADGVEGIEKGRELKPDLIVLDYSMPRINGLQAAEILHQAAPNTPIILLTIYKDAIPIRLARTSGVDSVLSKTEQLTILADEVQRLTGCAN